MIKYLLNLGLLNTAVKVARSGPKVGVAVALNERDDAGLLPRRCAGVWMIVCTNRFNEAVELDIFVNG